jgi:hypothetical protein
MKNLKTHDDSRVLVYGGNIRSKSVYTILVRDCHYV